MKNPVMPRRAADRNLWPNSHYTGRTHMVKGTGIDIADSERISRIIDKYGDHFIEKVFTREEIHYCSLKANPSLHYTGRWAAKEAFYKSLPGTCQAVSSWKSIEIRAGNFQAPVLHVCDTKLEQSMIKEGITRTHVSISHDRNLCVATVMLE
ncbi:MAG: holo-[acyl-carrier-protein] synthase [Chitinivibrionales bacterium]|nr:holo-[acyl-carrier-protein] synthase [Chitinivibrionales bacterium]